MSISHSIRLTLNIKDQNIHFQNNFLTEEIIDQTSTLIYHGYLSPATPKYCVKCGVSNSNFDIIKNGKKIVNIKMPRVSNQKTILRLAKQRYYCKHCEQTFSADTSLTDFKHSISRNTYLSSLLDSKTKISLSDIAKRYDISFSTLNKWLTRLNKNFKIDYTYLPPHLSFDEFRSVKTVHGKMSFIFMDSQNGNVINILQNRQLSYLKSYFFRYPLDVRKNVKTICIDMYEPYIQLIRSCFPNAKIVTDRFHIIQLINRSFNSTRVQVMKNNKQYYARYKRYWKILLKDQADLDVQSYKKFTGYNHLMTESLVVADLLAQDEILKNTYWLGQYLKQSIKSRDPKTFENIINKTHENISDQMKTTLKTFKKQSPYIKNALTYQMSNGKLEGTNNLVKVIKRIAFGYRNFYNFRARILLISNTMLRLEI